MCRFFFAEAMNLQATDLQLSGAGRVLCSAVEKGFDPAVINFP